MMRGNIEIGGSGYDSKKTLPHYIENMIPDYSIYNFRHSIGFLARGCRFNCKFCIVPQKEGRPISVNSVYDIHTNKSDFLILLDNDFFGNPEWMDRCKEIIKLKLRVNFSQGLNIRIITEEQCHMLAQIKFRSLSGKTPIVSFAWDKIRDEKLVFDGIQRVEGAGIKPRNMAFFVLVGFDTTKEEDMYRIELLRNYNPFVMPYDKSDLYQKKLARWVNHKAIFNSVKWRDYRLKKG